MPIISQASVGLTLPIAIVLILGFPVALGMGNLGTAIPAGAYLGLAVFGVGVLAHRVAVCGLVLSGVCFRNRVVAHTAGEPS